MIKPYQILIAPAAHRQIQNFSPKQRRHFIQQAEALAINPRPLTAKKIEGMTGLYSQDIQHCRIIYKVEEEEVVVLGVRV